MALEFSICEVRWERYRRVSENPHARAWLKFQAARGLAANTIEAYGRDLDRHLGFLETENIPFHSVIRPTIGAYIRSITQKKSGAARSPQVPQWCSIRVAPATVSAEMAVGNALGDCGWSA